MISTTTTTLLETIRSLTLVPTAPFREQWVLARLDSLLAEIPGLEVEVDRFGNRIARLRRGKASCRPAYFVAHLDHPGFLFPEGVATAREAGGLVYDAIFEGRVMDSFFPGSAVRLYRDVNDAGVCGVVLSAETEGRETGYRRVELEMSENADGAILGMWDVTPFAHKDDMVHSRACDDLVGVAAIVEGLRMLSDEKDVDVGAIFSRGEESGFCGVLCLLNEADAHPLVDLKGTFISVENSSELAGAPVGTGAIIRMGDRASTFDGRMVDSLWSVARRENLRARRMLMDRGTCEATPFSMAGLRAGGICVPLRNYHNMDQETGLIAPEAISLSDAESLVQLIRHYALAECQGVKPSDAVGHDYSLFLRKGRAHLSRD